MPPLLLDVWPAAFKARAGRPGPRWPANGRAGVSRSGEESMANGDTTELPEVEVPRQVSRQRCLTFLGFRGVSRVLEWAFVITGNFLQCLNAGEIRVLAEHRLFRDIFERSRRFALRQAYRDQEGEIWGSSGV